MKNGRHYTGSSGLQRFTENLREQKSVKLRWNSTISLSLLHNRCYQRQEITHREESSDSEGTMCYANGSSKWHTPAYYYMALSSSGQDTTLSRWRTRDRNPVVSPIIQPTDKALAYETRRWDACGRVCIYICLCAEARLYGRLSERPQLHK